MKISIKAIDNPLVVILFTVFIIIIGFMGGSLIPVELFPEIEIPVIIVNVPYIGAAPNELENEVIRKIEEKVRKIDNVKKIQAWAVNSLATVVVSFYENVDTDQAQTDVRNALNEAMPDLPSDIETPIVSAVDFSSIPVMTIAIYGKVRDYVRLREIAEDIQTPLEGVKGVASVSIFGGYDREIRIDLNPVKMRAYNLSVDYVVNYLKTSNLNFPGGNFRSLGNEYPMRIIGRFRDVQQLKQSIITFRKDPANPLSPLKPIKLSDIADVRDGIADIENISRFNGNPCVSLEIRKKKNINLLRLSDRVQKELNRLQKTVLKPLGLKFVLTGDQSDIVKDRVRDLFNSMWQGILVIFLVLWIGMGFRNALIASMGIPFCIIFTLAYLYFSGNTLNNLSQFGLIIVIGMVVDGAIVVLENIYRHREKGKLKRQASIDGLEEVGTSVFSSVLTTMAAFAPLLFMTGIVGQFMSNIPIAVLTALTASILFDHILIPVLATKIMSDPLAKEKKRKLKEEKRLAKHKKPSFINTIVNNLRFRKKNLDVIEKANLISKKKSKKDFKTSRLFRIYQKSIRLAVANRGVTLIIFFLIFVIGVGIFTSRPKELFPEFDLGQLFIRIELPPIAGIKQTNKIVKQIEDDLLSKWKKKKLVKYYISTVGSSGSGGSTTSVVRFSNKAIAMIIVELIDEKLRPNFGVKKFQKIVRNYVNNISGAKFQVALPKGGPPTGDPVNVVIQGKDIRILKRLSRKIQNLIRMNIRGAVDIKDNYGIGIPEIQATVRRRMADLHGIPIQTIARALSVTFNGLEVSKYYYGDKEIKVRVKIAEKFAKSLSDLQRIYFFKSSTGTMIHLNELVNLKMGSGLSVIAREDTRRSITVSGDVFGRPSTEVMRDVMKALKDFPLPPGYQILYRGENEERDESFKSLGIAFLGGFLLIYIIIVLQLRSFLQPLSIMATILLSVVGVGIGLLFSGSNAGIMAMFGAVALAGIVVNDAIVLISYINLLRERGYSKNDAIIEACETRLRPIFMTTFTTIGGLLPLGLALSGGSSKFWVPMAWAIIGGLLFATMQTLIAVPIIYSVFDSIKNKVAHIIKKIFKLHGKMDIAHELMQEKETKDKEYIHEEL